MPTHTSAQPARVAQPWTRWLAVLSLLVLAGLAGTGLARWLNPQASPTTAPQDPDLPDKLCKGWPKPDLAIVLSGEQHGYLLPCGCSRPQLGGLERRYNFIQKLRANGWPVAAVDLGDIPQHEAPAGLINNLVIPKYKVSMQALKMMGYSAVGVGALEIEQPLLTTFSEYALNNGNDFGPPYLLAANIDDNTRRNNANGIKPWILVEPRGSGMKIAVTSIIGPTVRKEARKKDKDTEITDTTTALPAVLKAMDAAHPDLRILLYHGSAMKANVEGWPPEAIAVAKKYPEFQIVVCLDDDDLAPNDAKKVPHADGKGETLVISLGHKGKAVGLLGVYRGKPGDPVKLRYQLAEMSESFMTPEGKDADNPILGLMQSYAQRLKETDAASKYPQTKHPLQLVQGNKIPEYVGSEACMKCHEAAYKIWEKSHHNTQAFKHLEDAKRPSLRQYDPECIVCHTVGFGRVSGYTSKEKTPDLLNVGCESCHGPASMHVDNYKDKEWRQKLNPWKAPANENAEAKTKRLDRIDQMCQSCHDIDNDVHWVHDGFKRFWPQVEHPTPPKPKP